MASKHEKQYASLVKGDNEKLRNPPCFGGFDYPVGYIGKSPRIDVLEVARFTVFEGMEQFYRCQAQMMDGQNLAGDQPHKVEYIKTNDGNVCRGVCTMLN